jgi:hypothetical protein
MGYSCTQAADNMLGLIRHTFSNGKYSNGLAIKGKTYFYEIGREHADGHITGTLFENISHAGFPDQEYARSAGHFSIGVDGQILRFPRITRNQMIALRLKFIDLSQSNPQLLSSYSHGAI